MKQVRSFVADRCGNVNVKLALVAASLSFVSVLAAVSVDRASRDGSLLKFAQSLGGGGQPATARRPGGAYDYTPTGAIPQLVAGNVILDPCLGVPK